MHGFRGGRPPKSRTMNNRQSCWPHSRCSPLVRRRWSFQNVEGHSVLQLYHDEQDGFILALGGNNQSQGTFVIEPLISPDGLLSICT